MDSNLKSRFHIALTGLCLAVFIGSCINATDFEDVPLEENTIDLVFEDDDSLGTKARDFLSSVYATMQVGHNRVSEDYLDAASDDAISSNDATTQVQRLVTGAYSASNPVAGDMRWTQYYEAIRKANVFINNIEVVPVRETFKDDISLKYAWKSEARFIKAWHYFNLLKRYGGVPLMEGDVPELGDNLKLPRNTFAECVDYIVSELDAIEDSLRTVPIPNPSINSHVATRSAALALKTRVLLYAASPLFNGENIDAQNPLTGYADYSAERWQQAANAAREFMEETFFSLIDDFGEIFTTVNSSSLDNPEVIFFRAQSVNTTVEDANGPVGYSSAEANGRTSPTQNLVDAFPMIDGLTIDDSESGYDPDNPYANRDPRLGHTVLYNGAQWLNTQLETFDGGRSRPGGTNQQTRTSYYLRKFMGDFETATTYANTVHDWVIFRYAEMLLNFAEAQNEYAGPSEEVYQVILDLRERAGIEPGPDGMYGLEENMTQDEMREVIRNERRIELAFEEHRFWDIRRWKIAGEIFSDPLYGMRIVQAGSNINYNRESVLTTDFEERRYLYPIPYDEVVGNSQMEQNPGW